MDKHKKIDISIIIVNYHVKKELFICIKSIIASQPTTSYEIIVVDNDEKKSLQNNLRKVFPNVIYIANENKGFGQGNNTGAKIAKGNFLFFLNPDTTIDLHCIDKLLEFLRKHKNSAIVAPLLYDDRNKLYPQGAKELNPLNAVFTFSFINKLFPNNPITRKYWMLDEWDKKSAKNVETIPGTAFVIRREIYEQIKGFDERFFLYFEEHDLCKRVKTLGWKISMEPGAKVYHALGKSTKQVKNISDIFIQSRFYYFRKHFGMIQALITEAFLRLNKYICFLTVILLIGSFLRFYNISDTMPFIGDQAWFYLSARDMLLTGDIPLVGIASSHPWLHQGALWTYLLSGALWLFNFNPVGGAYLTAILDIIAILLIYKLGSLLLSKRLGLIAAALYATSPLVVVNARMPYHTAPIPFVTIIALYFFYKVINGNKNYFPLLIFTIGTLYNLELATILLIVPLSLIILYGLVKKFDWAVGLFTKKIIFYSVFTFLLSMMPMLIYDTMHGYPQTLKFLAWIGYRLMVLVGFPSINAIPYISSETMLNFSLENYTQLIYPFNTFIAMSLLAAGAGYLLTCFKRRNKNIIVLAVLNILLMAELFLSKTPSSAYLPVMFPGLILVLAVLFNMIFEKNNVRAVLAPLFFILILFNCFYIISQVYFMKGDFGKRLSVAKYIVKESNGKEYNLKGREIGSQFETFTMNYEYLAWWLGNGPSHKPESLQFVISEVNNKFQVEKIEGKDQL